MHTMIVMLTLDPDQGAEVERHFREDVTAWAMRQPGFVTGSWLRSEDGGRGMGVVTFGTLRDAAAAACGPRSAPSGPAWSIDSVEIFDQLERV